ncbi:hypothetical protein V8E53_000940 [Lactarius tabidus]
MAPRTRQSHTKGSADSAQAMGNANKVPFESSTIANTRIRSKITAQRVVSETQPQTLQPGVGKRTHAEPQAPSGTLSSASESSLANLTKKARVVGPARGRPMPLQLPSGNGVENGTLTSNDGGLAVQQHQSDSVVKGKQAELQRTSSFYPGRGDNTHALARLDHGNYTFHAPTVDDDGAVSDDDSADDNQAVELALKYPNKFSESVAIERPSWVSSGPSEPEKSGSQILGASLEDTARPTGAASTTPPLLAQPGPDPTVPTPDLSIVATQPNDDVTFNLDVPRAGWPVNTNLVFAAGSHKLMLLNQRPIVRAVIQEAIENLRAALLFTNAFPDVCSALTLIKDCLFTAALCLKPGASEVLHRLTNDQDYLLRITPLPRARICLIRSEIKECCNTITIGAFMTFGSALDIIEYVRNQLSNYTYTFPRATTHNTPNGLVMRTRPYRNDRIITIIRDMFFTGGASSFARRFRYLFPTFEGPHAEQIYEVPIAMVALVATALYAALYEWRTGELQVAEFSANAYLDVYLGHMNTLKHIREKCEGAFHLMMANIYKQADSPPNGRQPNSGVAIAQIDLNLLDG